MIRARQVPDTEKISQAKIVTNTVAMVASSVALATVVTRME